MITLKTKKLKTLSKKEILGSKETRVIAGGTNTETFTGSVDPKLDA
ncbi:MULTISPECIES: hypothetical protein [unclassified Pseudoalteromonas]|nr:hypothetical protein [Pseudoalteromonas sp. XMcav2-N]MCO7191363.1 hypothetical protein [Pseudoalteromonas sp. XMcav2-N]